MSGDNAIRRLAQEDAQGAAPRNHFARPQEADKRESSSSCRTCGRPIIRRGRWMATDGRRGSWRHEGEKS